MVGGEDNHRGTTNILTPNSNYDDLDADDQDNENTDALVIMAQLVDRDEEANLGTKNKNVESFIQQEVESRLLMQQNVVTVAEPIDATQASTGTTTGTQQADRKVCGIKRKILCYMIPIVVLIIGGIVTGVLLSTQQEGKSTLAEVDIQQ